MLWVVFKLLTKLGMDGTKILSAKVPMEATAMSTQMVGFGLGDSFV